MGRLHLNWAGKDSIPRVETRLLLTDSIYPDGLQDSENILIQADNLLALKALSVTHRGIVKQIVIDPPYNVGSAFENYDDNLAHSAWLGLMRDRLISLCDLLCDQGSIWIFIDDDEMAYLQVLCDEIFGRKNRVANVIWNKKPTGANDASFFSDTHDYILVYAKSKQKLRMNLMPREQETIQRDYKNPDNDPRGLWIDGPMHVKTPNPDYIYPLTAPNRTVHHPPGGRSWAVPRETFEQLIEQNEIWFGASGSNAPRAKRFLDRTVDAAFKVRRDGVVPRTVWLNDKKGIPIDSVQSIPSDFSEQFNEAPAENTLENITQYIQDFLEEMDLPEGVGRTAQAKNEAKSVNEEPFSTPKPDVLLERIIRLGSNEGDIILDSFAGSGTTAAVAHKMRRKWILVEVMPETVEDHILPRILAIIDNQECELPGPKNALPSRVNEMHEWEGGGDFKLCSLAPSLLIRDDDLGIHLLNRDAFPSDEIFRSALCNYLGFEYVAIDGRVRDFIHGVSRIGNGYLHVCLSSLSYEMASHLSLQCPDEFLSICCITHSMDNEQLRALQAEGIYLIRIPRDIESDCDWGVSGYLWFSEQQISRIMNNDIGRSVVDSLIQYEEE